MEKKVYLIIGLENPGEKYAHTRHNAGFEVMDLLEKQYGVKLRKKILQPWASAEWTDGKKKIVLCRPLTFMNNSGIAVKKLMDRYGLPAEQTLILYDDIDLYTCVNKRNSVGGTSVHSIEQQIKYVKGVVHGTAS